MIQTAPKRRKGLGKRVTLTSGRMVLLVLLCLFSVFPFLCLTMTSIKPPAEIYSSQQTIIPKKPTLQGYADIFNPESTTFNFGIWLKNTLIVTFASTIISVLVASMGGYAMSRYRFIGRLTIGYLILVTQVVPASLLLIPLYITLSEIGLSNSLLGLTLLYTAFNIPYCTWTMKGYFDGIPVSLDEAAEIDGCNRPTAFIKVVMPLCIPGLIATSIFAFIASWNEYVFASVLLKTYDKWTVAMGLTTYKGQYTTNWNGIMAGGVVITVPIVIAFWLMQKHLITGMTAGAVKQ